MLIDRILAHFRIQTKVLLFILPFVISITAVGITGLYASGLLQGRIEISNSVLKSLSGFREVSAAMAQFLESASPESRDAVFSRLKAQHETLEMTMAQLSAKAEGRAELDSAIQSIDSITARIDGLWKLHENETNLRQDMK